MISRITIFESQVSFLSYDMGQIRAGLTLVAVESQGKIFAIGGVVRESSAVSANNYSRSVEVYNVETSQWSEANPTVVSCR